MKCYSKFIPDERTKRIVAERDAMLAKQKPPTRTEMQNWFNKMADIIQRSTGEKVTDDHLVQCFDDLDDDDVHCEFVLKPI